MVIKVDELMPDRLAENQSDRQQKETADSGNLVSGTRPESRV